MSSEDVDMKGSAISRFATSVIVLALIVSGCGSGSGGGGGANLNANAQSLSGTAASGSPIVGTVLVKDSLGATHNTTIGEAGAYRVDVTGMTPPFMLQAQGLVGNRSMSLYSAATAADIGNVINITPATDLVVAMAAQQPAGNYFAGGAFSAFTASALQNAQNTVRQQLMPVLTALNLSPTVDLLHASFPADHTGLDEMLDVMQVSPVAPNSMMIKNLADNSSVTCDVTNSVCAGMLTANNVSSYAMAVQQMAVQFSALAQLFTTGLPSPTNPTLRALFDQNNFMHEGENLNAFLGEMTSNQKFVGLQIAAINVEQLGSNQALVSYVLQAGGLSHSAEMQFNWSGSNWLMAGDQHRVSFGLKATSYLWNTISGGMMMSQPQIYTGMQLDISDPGNTGASYAVVTGPSLPTSNGGVTGKTVGALLFKNAAGLFQVAAPGASYNGTQTLSNSTPPYDFYPMTDAAIGSLSDNTLYTVQVYTGAGTLLGTYTMTMAKPPYRASSLAAGSFPALTVPTNMMTMAGMGGSASFSWTLPSGYKSDDLRMEQWGTAGQMITDDTNIIGSDTATTMTIPTYAGSLNYSVLWLSTADIYDRHLAWGGRVQ
jgi:hypothetical protein